MTCFWTDKRGVDEDCPQNLAYYLAISESDALAQHSAENDRVNLDGDPYLLASGTGCAGEVGMGEFPITLELFIYAVDLDEGGATLIGNADLAYVDNIADPTQSETDALPAALDHFSAEDQTLSWDGDSGTGTFFGEAVLTYRLARFSSPVPGGTATASVPINLDVGVC